MSVEVIYEDEVLYSIIIDGERYDTVDNNLIIIPIRTQNLTYIKGKM